MSKKYPDLYIVNDISQLPSIGRKDTDFVLVINQGIYQHSSATGSSEYTSSVYGGYWNNILTITGTGGGGGTNTYNTLDYPTNFYSTSQTSGSLELDWNDVTGSEKYYLDRASSPTGSWTSVYSGATSSYNDTGLTYLTTYYYRIKAWGTGYNTSSYSFTNASTSGTGSNTLSAPSNFVSTGQSSMTIDLDWSDVTNATSYILDRSLDGASNWTNIYTGSTSYYTNTGLSSSTTYYYRVKARGVGYNDSSYVTTNVTTAASSSVVTEAFIILQTGQSNAVGRAGSDPANEVTASVSAYEYRPDTNLIKALTDPVGIPGDNSQATSRSMNPALAKRLVELTGKPVLIVAAAVGNTNIDYWLNTSGSLYTTALSRWNAVKTYCSASNINILGSFVHWLQGENDAAIAMSTSTYGSRLNTMVDYFVRDFNPTKIFVTRVGYNDSGSIDADSVSIMAAQKGMNFCKDEMIVSTYSPATFTEGDKAITNNRVHYSVKGQNQVGQELAEAIYSYRNLNKKPVLTENVTSLQDPVGYFDDIYNFRSLTSGSNNSDYNEMFGRNNLTLLTGAPTFRGTLGLQVSGSTYLRPATVRTLSNTHDWTIEFTFRLDTITSAMLINGRSDSNNWSEDWLWVDGASSIQLKANNTSKSFSLTGATFNQLTNLVIVYTYADNTTKVYVNSSLLGTATDWTPASFKLESFLRGYTASPSITPIGIVERIRVVKKALATWEFDKSRNISAPTAIDWDFQFSGSITEAQGDTSPVLKQIGTNTIISPTFDADGIVFTSSSYLLTGQQFIASNKVFTIESRMKFNGTPGINFFVSEVTTNPGASGGGGNSIYIDTSGNYINMRTDTGLISWSSLTGYDWTQFHIFKFVNTTSSLEMFIDGVSKGTKPAQTGSYRVAMLGAGHPTVTYNMFGTMDYFKVKNSV